MVNIIASSVRNKLIVTTILVAVLAILMVGGYATWVATNELRLQAEREEALKLNALSQTILDFLAGLEQDVLFLSQTQALDQYLEAESGAFDQIAVEQNREALEKEFLAFAQTRGIYDQVRYLDAKGNEIVRINTDANGVSTIVPQAELQNKVGRYYFDDTIKLSRGQVFISPLDLNIERGQIEILPDGSNKPVIRYGTPVVFNNEVVGVIITNVLARHFLDPLKRAESLVYLADKDGFYLYHPDESKRWGRDLETNITLYDDYAGAGPVLLSSDQGAFIDAGNFFTHQPVQVFPNSNINWYLGVVRPQTEVFQPIFEFFQGALGVIFLTIVLAVVFAVIVDRIITVPLIDLNKAAVRVTKGDYRVEIVPKTRDEIGSLARAFNAMIGRVQESMGTMEKRVIERTHRLEIMAALGERFSAILDIDELLPEVVNQIQSNFGYYHAHIYLLDKSGKNLVVVEGTGPAGETMKLNRHSIALDAPASLVARAARSGQVVSVENVQESAHWLPNPLLPNTYSEMAVPITLRNQVVGVLDVQQDEIGGLNESDASLLRSLASQVAVAINNARLFEQTQQALQQSEAAQQQYMTQSWEKFRDAQRVLKAEQQKEGQIAGQEINNIKQQAIQKGQTVTTKSDNGHGGQPAVVAPLKLHGQVIGTLGLQQAAAGRDWSEEEIILLEAVSEQVTQALERARLFEETQQQAAREKVIADITGQIWASGEFEQVMRTTVQQLGRTLDASKVVIRLGTDEQLIQQQFVQADKDN